MEAPITLVVGLGNPGAQYADTRHNLGWMLVDRFIDGLPRADEPEHTADSHLWTLRYAGRKLLVQKPLTYMNLSGQAVSLVARRLQIPTQQILVIHDELDLPLGRIRLRQKGSSGGNNGIASLISCLGTDRFRRMRLGIDGPHRDDTTIDYVLSPFATDEHDLLERLLSEADTCLKTLLRAGFTRAMNQYNSIDLRIPPATEADADHHENNTEPEESDP